MDVINSKVINYLRFWHGNYKWNTIDLDKLNLTAWKITLEKYLVHTYFSLIEYFSSSYSQSIIWQLSFLYYKNEFWSSMSGAGRYKIGSYVTSKKLHLVHLSECVRRYGS